MSLDFTQLNQALTEANTIATDVTQPQFWVSAGFVLVGVIIVVLGIYSLLRSPEVVVENDSNK